jgi:hypothetical protein
MRLISDIDWSELFENVSLVDKRLRAESDFADGFSDPQSLPECDRTISPAFAMFGDRGGQSGT